MLAGCMSDLDRALHALGGEAAIYFGLLHRIGTLLLERPEGAARLE